MRRGLCLLVVLLISTIFGCSKKPDQMPYCEWGFHERMMERIPIQSIVASKSTLVGNSESFIHPCKPTASYAIGIKDGTTKTHQVVLELDASYPIRTLTIAPLEENHLTAIPSVSIDLSINGLKYTRHITNRSLTNGGDIIELNDANARYIRLVFAANPGVVYGLQDVSLTLGGGLIVREETEWSNAFLRTSGWTGADGIFSFNLNGNDRIGAPDPLTAFVFSDTFVGNVNPFNYLRLGNKMINNSVGYYDGTLPIKNGMSFSYRTNFGVPESAFLPTEYVGFQPGNLFDSDGLSHSNDASATISNESEGIVWRSASMENVSLTIDLLNPESIGALTIWNDNGMPANGVKDVSFSVSMDGLTWETVGTMQLNAASGSPNQPSSGTFIFSDSTARYLRLTLETNHGGEAFGLGKLFLQSSDGAPLYGAISSTSTDMSVVGNERSSRLWLQDGLVHDSSIYLFPLLVKDDGSIFKVTRVGMIKASIVSGQIQYEQSISMSTPLLAKTKDGSVITFGAGVMDHHDIDGYVYVYGYIDRPGRKLAVARVKPEDFENFNRWVYFDGQGWSNDITDSIGLLDGVSPELSVTHIEEGQFAGSYMLVAMEGTTSGRVSYSLSDSPWGPFSEFRLLYETYESTYLNKAFTYNAKLHAHLSQPGRYLISYNVNTTKLSALVDARIYYPRFILVTEVKPSQENAS
jgi:hypothetical protein